MNKPMEKNETKIRRIIDLARTAFSGMIINDTNAVHFFNFLCEDFVDLDIEEELKQYYAWTLDQLPNGKKMNHHSRFRYWLKKAQLMKNRKHL